MAKRCRNVECKSLFEPTYSSMQMCCSPRCAIAWGKTDASKVHVKKAIRADTRERKKVFREKDKPWWVKKAQQVFNKWIRGRDEGEFCISCHKPVNKKGNAGHYKTVGAHPALRFDEDNCHLQCEYCNTYLSGNIENYRINLVVKIGIDRVQKLEGPHDAKHYTIDDLKEIIERYKLS